MEFKDIVALVVEDNEFLRKIVAHVLSDLGIEDVRFVRTEEDGLHAFVERPAHIVIIEFSHEYQAAYDMLKKLRESPHCTHGATGLIALVPAPDRERVIKAHDAGAEAVVAEPIAPKELVEHVKTIIHRHLTYKASRAGPGTGRSASQASAPSS